MDGGRRQSGEVREAAGAPRGLMVRTSTTAGAAPRRAEPPSRRAKLPVTVLVAAKNEEANMARCLSHLEPAAEVIVLDSGSTDRTATIAKEMGFEVVQFSYAGGYPKKRQWALENLP